MANVRKDALEGRESRFEIARDSILEIMIIATGLSRAAMATLMANYLDTSQYRPQSIFQGRCVEIRPFSLSRQEAYLSAGRWPLKLWHRHGQRVNFETACGMTTRLSRKNIPLGSRAAFLSALLEVRVRASTDTRFC